jgi:streptogramin lyase
VAGPDGNLWFQFNGRMVIGCMSPAGVYQEFPVASGEQILDIAAGIDGNLWFTVINFGGVDSWIGRATPSGVVTEFPLPQFSSPRGITAGPDGALWFSDGGDVGRINPGVSASSFFTVTPCRAVDTRNANGPLGGPALTANVPRTFGIAGQCGIPPSARAISANVTVVGAATPGYITIYPGGTSIPLVSALNYRAGQVRANNAVVSLGAAGDVTVFAGQPSGTVHFILDVNGYFQ